MDLKGSRGGRVAWSNPAGGLPVEWIPLWAGGWPASAPIPPPTYGSGLRKGALWYQLASLASEGGGSQSWSVYFRTETGEKIRKPLRASTEMKMHPIYTS